MAPRGYQPIRDDGERRIASRRQHEEEPEDNRQMMEPPSRNYLPHRALTRSDSSSTLEVMMNKRKHHHRRRPSLDSASILTSGTPTDAYSLGGPTITRHNSEENKWNNNRSLLLYSSEQSVITCGSLSIDQVGRPSVTNPNFLTTTTTTSSSLVRDEDDEIDLGRRRRRCESSSSSSHNNDLNSSSSRNTNPASSWSSNSNSSRNTNTNPASSWNIKTKSQDDNNPEFLTPDSEESEKRMIRLAKEMSMKEFERPEDHPSSSHIPKPRRYSLQTSFSSTSAKDLCNDINNKECSKNLPKLGMRQTSMTDETLLTSGTVDDIIITEALVENHFGVITKRTTSYPSSKVVLHQQTSSSSSSSSKNNIEFKPKIINQRKKKSTRALTESEEDDRPVQKKVSFSETSSTPQQQLEGNNTKKSSSKNRHKKTKITEEVSAATTPKNCSPLNNDDEQPLVKQQQPSKSKKQQQDIVIKLNNSDYQKERQQQQLKSKKQQPIVIKLNNNLEKKERHKSPAQQQPKSKKQQHNIVIKLNNNLDHQKKERRKSFLSVAQQVRRRTSSLRMQQSPLRKEISYIPTNSNNNNNQTTTTKNQNQAVSTISSHHNSKILLKQEEEEVIPPSQSTTIEEEERTNEYYDDNENNKSFWNSSSNVVFNRPEGSDIKYVPPSSSLDINTRSKNDDNCFNLTIKYAIEQDMIQQCNEVIHNGRDSIVFHADGGSRRSGGHDVAVKKILSPTSFFDDNNDHSIWRAAKAEFTKLVRAHRNFVPVPSPLLQKKNLIFMRFMGEHGFPARRMGEVELSSKVWMILYSQVMVAIRRLYVTARLVHGSLSEDSILVCPSDMVENKTFSGLNDEQDVSIQAVFVGFDKSIEVDDDNEETLPTLKRDVERIRKFFAGRGVDALSEEKSIEFVTSPEVMDTNYDNDDDDDDSYDGDNASNSVLLSDDDGVSSSSNVSASSANGKRFRLLSRLDSSSSIRTVANNHNFDNTKPSKLLRGISDSSSVPGDIGRRGFDEPKKIKSIANSVNFSGTMIHWEARDIASSTMKNEGETKNS
eukprot:CAMPEP_0194161232 /NCGR_PEP_ID=MMETSP0152-20130528/78827_1 /TAXON_ID=1049557 /ORGANISM="Thalassiothrix antarctica, Strain L6-D1" /LENGTH=1048 /DNA_ID=CAMNT_0038871001 /DNA_START=95 /DNA_END=3241 /DNA_ORIENTATION=+